MTVLSDPPMPPTVVQIGGLTPALDTELCRRYGTTVVAPTEADPAALAAFGPVRIAVTSGRAGVTARMMDAWPNLGAIVTYGVGYEKTDVALARARGIQISNTPDVLTDCVADLAVGALIGVARRLAPADRFVRSGCWARGAFPLATRVSGKRVGILGLGKIGTAIARRLSAFDMPIAYHSRRIVESSEHRYVGSVRQLAEECDFLVVAASGGPDSHGIVSADVLAALGPDGYLVNVSRGGLIDEAALVSALAAGAIGGAALDVFADEPRVPDGLLALDRVLLLPHVGSATRETRAEMARLVIANIEGFLADGRLVTPI
ncbi:MAG TPA: 2-hydroxyacid dehydrogenase [Microbacteriaceae bacterium]